MLSTCSSEQKSLCIKLQNCVTDLTGLRGDLKSDCPTAAGNNFEVVDGEVRCSLTRTLYQ